MQNQFAVWLAAMFGLTQCTEELENQDTNHVPATELVGTWMEVRTTFDSTNNEHDWVSTERRTIIVEKAGDGFRFRNCQDDVETSATVDGNDVTLSAADYPVLTFSESGTLTGKENIGDTEVTLQRLTTSTQAVVAQLDMNAPLDTSAWTQLCLETVVTPDAENRLSFKAIQPTLPLFGTGNAMVTMAFGFPQQIAAGTYNYPDPQAQHTVSGTYKLSNEAEEGVLSDPVSGSTLQVSGSATRTFQANLTMHNSEDSGGTTINGVLTVESRWLEAELQ